MANRLTQPDKADQKFATEVLKYQWRVNLAAAEGRVKSVASPFGKPNGDYRFYNELNADCYVVEAPDAIEPASPACTFMRYSENNLSAGVAYKGTYKTCVLGFPFETLRTAEERNRLMEAILTFFDDGEQ